MLLVASCWVPISHLALSVNWNRHRPHLIYKYLSVFLLNQVFQANTDRDRVVSHQLNPVIEARYVRVRPMDWKGHISMRMELYC